MFLQESWITKSKVGTFSKEFHFFFFELFCDEKQILKKSKRNKGKVGGKKGWNNPPCCHLWPPPHPLLCGCQGQTARAGGPERTPACSADTGSCPAARWTGTDSALHPPTPPQPPAPRPGPGHASLTGEQKVWRQTQGSGVHKCAPGQWKGAAELQLASADDKP